MDGPTNAKCGVVSLPYLLHTVTVNLLKKFLNSVAHFLHFHAIDYSVLDEFKLWST